MSINVRLFCYYRHRHRQRNFCLLLITFLFFDLVKGLPITNNDNDAIVASSSRISTTTTDSSLMIENVTAIVESVEDIFNSTDTINFNSANITNTTIYDYEEEVPTLPSVTCDAWYEQLCENGIECILKQFMCDGRRDCSDGSDEASEICQNQRVEDFPNSKGRFLPPTLKCPEDWFFCKDASRCIESASACNGIDDCNDGSDEGGFCHYLNIERRLSSFSNNNETFQQQ